MIPPSRPAPPRPAWRRYLLFQIPGWILAGAAAAALHRWFGVPLPVALLILALFVAKDFVLYPFLRRSYEQVPGTPLERLIGERGVAVETLAPEGFVRVRGELWRAAVRPAGVELPRGAAVVVESTEGWKLVVKPAEAAGPQASRGAAG
jgi:membrane protein implicated in regulation of membrane protease activity